MYSEKIKRLIKARDQFGLVIPIVERKKREMAAQGLTDLHEAEAGGVSADKQAGEGGKATGSENALSIYGYIFKNHTLNKHKFIIQHVERIKN